MATRRQGAAVLAGVTLVAVSALGGCGSDEAGSESGSGCSWQVADGSATRVLSCVPGSAEAEVLKQLTPEQRRVDYTSNVLQDFDQNDFAKLLATMKSEHHELVMDPAGLQQVKARIGALHIQQSEADAFLAHVKVLAVAADTPCRPVIVGHFKGLPIPGCR